MSDNTDKDKSIALAAGEVIAFLDIFDYPPTAMEIWRFLGVKTGLSELVPLLLTACRHSFSGGAMEGLGVVNFTGDDTLGVSTSSKFPLDEGRNLGGFFFLPGREELVAKRSEFFHLAEKKFKIAKRAAWFLHFIPSVKMVALCNNFYYRPESDIDFFIISSAKRLWLTRFFATIILDIFNLRARGKMTADKICLSFYLSEDNANLENVILKPDDPYFYYWLAFLEPIYGLECYRKFWEENSWLKSVFPNLGLKNPVLRRRLGDDLFSALIKNTGGFCFRGALGDLLERIAKKIQWRRLSPEIKAKAARRDEGVILNEAMLKFHENDRRAEFREQLRIKKEELKIE
jgi:hypothetical protein